jgi:carbon starvation protein
MIVLLLLLGSVIALGGGGLFYSRRLARQWGEDSTRITPAVELNDGRDYVPTPTPVVFAHHFASIAGAGPIIGPVIAICFGWLPALLWIVFGSVLVGGVHDYLSAFMATREGGRSVATVARKLLGRGPFIALMLFLVLSLALVCATFLNLSAQALTSMVPHARLGLDEGQTLFRTAGAGAEKAVVIGGIASTSVIVITLFSPLVGYLYIKRNAKLWFCSLLSLAICSLSLWIGVEHPVAIGQDSWRAILAVYVLLAAGLPVWLFLQSRDFINVHVLYVGLALLLVTLVVASVRGGGYAAMPDQALPALDLAAGTRALGSFWPVLFITIACGAVSGFHSLCAGGTTCKQLTSERAARRTGYWGMILEGFLAACVVSVLLVGASRTGYLADVHPALVGSGERANPILGFAMAVGRAGNLAWGIPVAAGALAGMVLLESFLVTTLDTAVRLMRYLLEEVWREVVPAARHPLLARVLGQYWVNSGIAVGLMLLFAFSGGIMALWALFATSNQLLAAFVLMIGGLWLMSQARAYLPAVVPAVGMLATTGASLVLLFRRFGATNENLTLLVADVALMVLGAYLLVCWILKARALLTARARAALAA